MTLAEIKDRYNELYETIVNKVNNRLKDLIGNEEGKDLDIYITRYGNSYTEPHLNGDNYCVWHTYYDGYGNEYEYEERIKDLSCETLIDILEELGE